MSNYFEQFDEILYHNLRPWLDENINISRFSVEKPKKDKVVTRYASLYDVDFYRPFNAKAEFYATKLELAYKTTFIGIIDTINESDNTLHQQRVYQEIINIVIPKRINDIIEIIRDRHYFTEYIDPKKGNFEVNLDHKTDSFILQLLKVYLVKLHLEIQENFSQFNKELPLTERDIYERFFNQNLPDNSFLKRNNNTIEKKAPTSSPKSSVLKEGAVSRLSLTLQDFNANSDKLSDLFKFLKEHELISKETPLASFKWIFSGKDVASPVIWSGSVDELHYFVYLIHDKLNLIETIKRNYWKVVCKCFLKDDGTSFNANELKNGSKPGKYNILDKAITLLK